jgi:hypothetical protein
MSYLITVVGSQQELDYCNTTNHPMHNTGQGSGSSPHIRATLSSILVYNEAMGTTYE